jgi:ligand-binding sensor protein
MCRSCIAEAEPEFGEFPVEVVIGGIEIGIAAGGQLVEEENKARMHIARVMDDRHGRIPFR